MPSRFSWGAIGSASTAGKSLDYQPVWSRPPIRDRYRDCRPIRDRGYCSRRGAETEQRDAGTGARGGAAPPSGDRRRADLGHSRRQIPGGNDDAHRACVVRPVRRTPLHRARGIAPAARNGPRPRAPRLGHGGGRQVGGRDAALRSGHGVVFSLGRQDAGNVGNADLLDRFLSGPPPLPT